MRRLNAVALDLPGLFRIERQRLGDARGYLSRLFCADELAEQGWNGPVAQINLTHTRARGTVRGLHFQHPPHAEMKLVSCLRGEVWDVAVDLRAGSPTFLQWRSARLSAENGHALLIPADAVHATYNETAEPAKILAILSPAVDGDGYAAVDVAAEEPWASLRP